jgi:acetyl esterase/lipase
MTTATDDPVRRFWEAQARGEDIPWESLTAEPDGVERVSVDVPSGLWLRPADARAGTAILAIHGGGFVSGSIATHRRMFGHLARAAGVSTLAIEYGLVPEGHVFPSQIDTVEAAYRALLDSGVTRVALAGDSCGGTLAVSLAVRARDGGLPLPAAMLLLSPWSDFEALGQSYDSGSDPLFAREFVRGLGAGYLAGADSHDPLAAPIHADLRGLPPAYLQAGAEESLLDDSRRLAHRLRDAGVAARLDEFPGQLHTFQMAGGHTAVADDAIERAGSWLRSTLSS